MEFENLLKKYNLPLEELLQEAKTYTSNNVEFCSLISAKTGKCSENCKYCAQSSHYFTEVFSHPLVEIEDVIKVAREAKENGAGRFAIVTSGRTPSAVDLEKMCEMIKAINALGLKSCASLGILDEEQVKKLKSAGLCRYHHNINTAKSYHSSINTTHTFEDRLNTAQLIKNEGIELCCGVIVGMGESIEQRVEMALELARIEPQSIPFNILTPIKGTPFEGYINKINEENILRTLAIFKIANPKSVLRFAGGRFQRLSEKNREIALKNCVEGILIGNMLTTIGIKPNEDIQTLKNLGKNLVL